MRHRRAAPPVWFAALPPAARAYQGRRAGLVSRGIAALVDTAVVAAAVAGVYLAGVGVRFTLNPVGFAFPAPSRPVVLAAGCSLAGGYLTVCWTATGRTVGDQLLGLRVVDRHGRLIRLGPAVVRAACCVFFPLGLIWVVVGEARRSLPDLVLRTAVVYDWDPHPPGSPGSYEAAGVPGQDGVPVPRRTDGKEHPPWFAPGSDRPAPAQRGRRSTVPEPFAADSCPAIHDVPRAHRPRGEALPADERFRAGSSRTRCTEPTRRPRDSSRFRISGRQAGSAIVPNTIVSGGTGMTRIPRKPWMDSSTFPETLPRPRKT